MQSLEPVPDKYEFAMLAAGSELGIVELPENASITVAHARLLLYIEETNMPGGGCTLHAGVPLPWPESWNAPAIATEGVMPKYFAYVHLHAGSAAGESEVEELEERLRADVRAFDVGTVYFHHRMEWVATRAGLPDQAKACLLQRCSR